MVILAMSYGKWIGGMLGWASGGPIGGVIGFALGAMLDGMGTAGKARPETTGGRTGARTHETTGGDVAMSLVVLTAAVMNSDGRVTRMELDYVRRFFTQQFGGQRAQELLLVLRDVLKRDIPVGQVCEQIRQYAPHPLRLQLVHYLIGVAQADGHAHAAEREMVRRIGAWLGVSEKDLESMSAMFRRATVDNAYTILEVDPRASDDEVKAAYRRMAKKHHPDKVSHLGEEFQRSAAEKFKKVQEAWERVKDERGIP
jgi:DnaJ like chaperone protein